MLIQNCVLLNNHIGLILYLGLGLTVKIMYLMTIQIYPELEQCVG